MVVKRKMWRFCGSKRIGKKKKKIKKNTFFHNQNKIGLHSQVFGDYDIGKKF